MNKLNWTSIIDHLLGMDIPKEDMIFVTNCKSRGEKLTDCQKFYLVDLANSYVLKPTSHADRMDKLGYGVKNKSRRRR